MKQRQIECFLAVAKYLNYSRAAEALFVSQSVISYQIAALEKELQVSLFQRDTHRVSLTEAGRVFYQRLLPLKEEWTALLRDMAALAQKRCGPMRFGIAMPISADLRAKLIAALNKAFPTQDISMIDYNYMDAHETLLAGNVDFLLGFQSNVETYDFIDYITLTYETNHFLLRSDDPDAKKPALTLEDLKKRVIIYPAGAKDHRDAGKIYTVLQEEGKPQALYQYTGCDNVQALVRSGLGIGLVPSATRYVGEGLTAVPFGDMRIHYALSWRKDRQPQGIHAVKEILGGIFSAENRKKGVKI